MHTPLQTAIGKEEQAYESNQREIGDGRVEDIDLHHRPCSPPLITA